MIPEGSGVERPASADGERAMRGWHDGEHQLILAATRVAILSNPASSVQPLFIREASG
jgi:hypothetical protein